jgi:hypothetical protein
MAILSTFFLNPKPLLPLLPPTLGMPSQGGCHLLIHLLKSKETHSSVHAWGKKALLIGTPQSHSPLRLVELPFSHHHFSISQNFLFRFTFQLPA